jgi:hypothetical protein
MKQKTWERFLEVADIDQRVNAAFPGEDMRRIRETAKSFAKLMGQSVRNEELDDADTVSSLVEISLSLAPHVTLDEQLRAAAEAGETPLKVVTAILRAAKVAELSSFGRIADERLKVIGNLERLKDKADTGEAEFQKLLEGAPWLIDPQWSPITANQSFATLRSEFAKYYEAQTGTAITLSAFALENKRADFVMTSQDGIVQVVEIKRPHHSLKNEEMERLERYHRMIRDFLAADGNKEFRKHFLGVRITLVCDELGLTGLALAAFEGLARGGELDHLSWQSFLLRTTRAHQDFLDEANRQRKIALAASGK